MGRGTPNIEFIDALFPLLIQIVDVKIFEFWWVDDNVH